MQRENGPLIARPLDGRLRAAELRTALERRVADLRLRHIHPTLGIVLVGDDPSSHAYVGTIERTAQRLGIMVLLTTLPANTTAADVSATLAALSSDPNVHGLVLQQPLPAHLNGRALAEEIAPDKDVDGANPTTQGHIALNSDALFTPATPRAVIELLKISSAWPLTGKHAVVVGKSTVVGMPVAILLMNQNATVTVTHRETINLAEHTRRADVIISAAGVPGLIKGDMLKPGVVVIDVGTTVVDDNIVGDIDAPSVSLVASELTPVPGGVGPVTTATLLANVVDAAERK